MAAGASPSKALAPSRGLSLALSGGGLRGIAHLGVLQVLEREGLEVAAIAGASMGGLLGALAAAGVPLSRIEEELARLGEWRYLLKLVDLRISHWGVSMRGARVHELLSRLLGAELRFDEVTIQLALVASDLASGREVVLREGRIADAVRATISVPGFFEPVARGRMRLVDGGLLNNLPVDVARTLVDRPVVAVDVLPRFRANTAGEEPVVLPLRAGRSPRNLREALHLNMMMIGETTALRLALHPPDLVLRPEIPRDVTLLFGHRRSAELIAAGRAAAEAALPQLRELARE